MKTIYLVWADRGCYSEHSEYAVCWFKTEAAAKARAEKMQKLSEEWLVRIANADFSKIGWDKRDPMWAEAMKEIGDDAWSPSDGTTYTAQKLGRGH